MIPADHLWCSRYRILDERFEEHIQKERQAAATPNINCKECRMQFESKDNLRIHIKKVHSGRRKKKTRAPIIVVIRSKFSSLRCLIAQEYKKLKSKH